VCGMYECFSYIPHTIVNRYNLCVLFFKERLCPSSGYINRLMMMMVMIPVKYRINRLWDKPDWRLKGYFPSIEDYSNFLPLLLKNNTVS
jgi:hypothetical protein